MEAQDPPNLTASLHNLLKQLYAYPYPVLPSPEGCNRRASVALIIRIKPACSQWPPDSAPKPNAIDDFFAQEWVQQGEPEVLFIKRASRKGDRWTSHIALPGGKRDPEDADDYAAAVRETSEEVGLDLNAHALPCGNIPQRIVTTHWGKKPLLVLCPYVFILTTHNLPALRLQPSEVASTHWVPIRNLQSPLRRTIVYEDFSARIAAEETGVKRWMLRLILGKMMFSAIALLPTESLHSAEPLALSKLQDNRHAPATRYTRFQALASRIWNSDLWGQVPALPAEGPLLLWGLTLGVMSDFLDLLPPHNALTVWTYPTFTPLDVRFTIWLMTYNFRHRRRVELQAGHTPPFGFEATNVPPPGSAYLPTTTSSSSLTSSAPTPSSSAVLVPRPDETGYHGLGTGLTAGDPAKADKSRKAAVSTMLEGLVKPVSALLLPQIADRARYYDILRRAVAVALVGRATMGVVLVLWVWSRLRRRSLRR